MRTTMVAVAAIAAAAAAFSGCGGGGDGGADDGFAGDIVRAVAAIEAELGAGQEFFEVTATPQLTNVFVAVEDATAAVPYVFLDGELQPPAPALSGTGFTFTADAIDFDEDVVLDQVVDELPDATIAALSVEGGEGGAVRYVVSVQSAAGGALDVTVAPDGTVLAVDPV